MNTTAAEFVIRSMSTTDYRPAMRCGTRTIPEQNPQPYHVYLTPIEQRAGAFWANHISRAMRFTTLEDAQAEADRAKLSNYEISATDDPSTFWGNRDAERAASSLSA